MPVNIRCSKPLSLRDRLRQAEIAYAGLMEKAKAYIAVSQAEIQMLREENERLRKELETANG